MEFTPEDAKVPTSIGEIDVTLVDRGEVQSARYDIYVNDSGGETLTIKAGDLSPHLSEAQISGLIAFLADVRQKAQAFLPK